MTLGPPDVRVSGKTADEEAIDRIREENEQLPISELPEERSRSFRFPGFSRMRTDWYGEDGITLRRVQSRVEDIIDNTFNDLFAIREELYSLVRFPALKDDVIQTDRHGWIIWKKTEMGNYEEDWGRLDLRNREKFLFQITTRIFEWEERRDQLWAAAMFAKTQWEEAFSTGWQETGGNRPTEGDKTTQGRLTSQEERYFAIYATFLSRRADSLVAGMERLAQRIKDVHTA
jgi:hypothetical protein